MTMAPAPGRIASAASLAALASCSGILGLEERALRLSDGGAPPDTVDAAGTDGAAGGAPSSTSGGTSGGGTGAVTGPDGGPPPATGGTGGTPPAGCVEGEDCTGVDGVPAVCVGGACQPSSPCAGASDGSPCQDVGVDRGVCLGTACRLCKPPGQRSLECERAYGSDEACCSPEGSCATCAPTECAVDGDPCNSAPGSASGRGVCHGGSCVQCVPAGAGQSSDCMTNVGGTLLCCRADFVCTDCGQPDACATLPAGAACDHPQYGVGGICQGGSCAMCSAAGASPACQGAYGPGRACCTAMGCAPCAAPSCTDGAQDGSESDTDCGGSCAPCAAGKRCFTSLDCTPTQQCLGNVCAVVPLPTCMDLVKNGTETDVDCGGSCASCPTGMACAVAADCANRVCRSGVCHAPACGDGVTNIGESCDTGVPTDTCDGDCSLPYAFSSQWGTLGNGNGSFSTPTRVAVAPSGTVYVVDTGNARIQVFAPAGAFLAAWPGATAIDLDVGAAGDVYLLLGTTVERRDASGNVLGSLGVTGSSIAVSREPPEEIYVTDMAQHRVRSYTTAGTFVREWGTNGSGPGAFNEPADVAVRGATVYVADRQNRRVQLFDRGGAYLRAISTGGANPAFVAVDSRGRVAVSTIGSGYRIEFFDGMGAALFVRGGNGSAGGQFENSSPHAAILGAQLFATDGGNHRVQVFE